MLQHSRRVFTGSGRSEKTLREKPAKQREREISVCHVNIGNIGSNISQHSRQNLVSTIPFPLSKKSNPAHSGEKSEKVISSAMIKTPSLPSGFSEWAIEAAKQRGQDFDDVIESEDARLDDEQEVSQG